MAVTRLTLIFCLWLPAAAIAGEDGHETHDHQDHATKRDDHADHVTRIDGLEILHAWAQATEGDEARIFMEIANEGDTDLTITGGATEIGGTVTLMAINYSDGGTPVDIGSFPLKAGEEIDLTPGGLFFSVADLAQHLDQGMSFDMHLIVDPIGEVDIVVEVEAADAATHSHAGHNH
ncbi:MAG: copper chaperone PCu(A)C [Pseudomonadota bacterium]